MVETLGIYAELQARRAAVADRLSPAARHAAFPTVYAKPAASMSNQDKLRAEIRRLAAERDALIREKAALQADGNRLRAENVALKGGFMSCRQNSPTDVLATFLQVLNATRIGAPEWTVGHLTSPRRAREYIGPRHVAMWLVRHVSTHYSLPMIGRLFGNRDHTSAMHAMNRAPHWMANDPTLQAAAAATLARFGMGKGEGEPT